MILEMKSNTRDLESLKYYADVIDRNCSNEGDSISYH